jgi:hypothetical protein
MNRTCITCGQVETLQAPFVGGVCETCIRRQPIPLEAASVRRATLEPADLGILIAVLVLDALFIVPSMMLWANDMLFVVAIYHAASGGLLGAILKNRPLAGAVVSVLLGCIGHLVVALVLGDYRPKCPHCFAIIKAGAIACPRCGAQAVNV